MFYAWHESHDISWIGLYVSGGLVQWPAELGNKRICVLYPLSKIVEDY